MNSILDPTLNKNYLLLLLLVLFQMPVHAQITFAYWYDNGYIGNQVRQLPDHDYIVAGGEDGYDMWYYEVFGKTNADLFLMRTDEYSDVKWQKTYGTDSTRESAAWVEITSDGGLIIVGSSTFEQNISQSPSVPMDSSDIIVLKTDVNGIREWGKRFDSGGDDLGYSVHPCADGGYLVSGFTDSNPVSLTSPAVRAWLLKLDIAGNVVWEGKYQFAIRDFLTGRPFVYVTKQLQDKGYLMVGTTNSAHPADLYVMQLDSVGVVQWAKSYDHLGLEFNFSGAYDFWEKPDSTVVITGFMDKDRNGSPQGLNYPYVLHLDDTGKVIKANGYDYPSFRERTGFSSVHQTNDNGFVFCGKAGYGGSGEEMVILKTDDTLGFAWGRHYSFGGMPMGGAKNARQALDGGYVLTGIRSFDGTTLLKMDTVGLIACHTPNPMTEWTPTITVVNYSPDTTQGYTVVDWDPPVDLLTEDTLPLCRLDIPLASNTLTFWGEINPAHEVILSWNPEDIEDIGYFEVYRSIQGADFVKLGSQSALGDRDQGEGYQFVDGDPVEGHHAYQLKVYDLNGNTWDSDIVSFWIGEQNFSLEGVRHTVGSDRIRMDLSMPHDAHIGILISDLLGKPIFTVDKYLQAGRTSLSLTIPELASGVYTLSLIDFKEYRVMKKIFW